MVHFLMGTPVWLIRDSKMKMSELKKIFGERVIMELFSFVKNDSISKFNLEKMAVEMGVIQTYNAFKDREPFNPEQIFSRMIDKE